MATSDDYAEVTAALDGVRAGDPLAKERLVELAYADLRAAAGRLMKRERAGHTLQPTALVHESLGRLLDTCVLERMEDRNHLIAAATLAFKRILIDHARARAAQKRGGALDRLPFDAIPDQAAAEPAAGPPALDEDEKNPFDLLLAWYDEQGLDVLALDEAMEDLRALDERWFDVVLLRFFGGFGIDRTAELVGVSPRTIATDWTRARAWLHTRLGDEYDRPD